MSEKVIKYDIMNEIKDDSELQKEVIKQLLNELQEMQIENEQLKKEIWQLQHREMWNKEATLQAELLIKENERLKALCDTYFTCYRAKHNDIDGNLFSYRKALEEIREMVNEPCVPSENDCLTCPTSCFTKDILIKINEVLEVNNG